MIFVKAQAPAVRLLPCRLTELDATQLHTRGTRSLAGSRATDAVYLAGAHIGGILEFMGATLSNDSGPALDADGLQVDAARAALQGSELRQVVAGARSLSEVLRHLGLRAAGGKHRLLRHWLETWNIPTEHFTLEWPAAL
jgi:hypothetical protein